MGCAPHFSLLYSTDKVIVTNQPGECNSFCPTFSANFPQPVQRKEPLPLRARVRQRVVTRHALGGTHFCAQTRGRNSFPLISLALSWFLRLAAAKTRALRQRQLAVSSTGRALLPLPLGTKFGAEPRTRRERRAHSLRQISLSVSRPYAHVVRAGLFWQSAGWTAPGHGCYFLGGWRRLARTFFTWEALATIVSSVVLSILSQ